MRKGLILLGVMGRKILEKMSCAFFKGAYSVAMMNAKLTEALKNKMISARFLLLVADGKTVEEAFNITFAGVMTYKQFADDLYDTLRANAV